MSGRPIFYMDIDGVCNLFGDAVDPSAYRRRVTVNGFSPFIVTLNPYLAEMVTCLDQVFELRWASMWQADSCTVFARVAGFGHDWPYIEFTQHGTSISSVIDYKIPGVINDSGNRPFIWADDDFALSHVEWAENRSLTVAPTRLITTEPEIGLTAEHVEEALLWARVFA